LWPATLSSFLWWRQ